ncbi:amino acid ABC transporter substrate-binding protein [Streptococcus loxodontisalivarius]|uniref:Polar amino acid transport system substrate-binding protein n=1 Tax=Streptococcus loxodontisalivarius TaxID=1349415 RepID=A0ABS2PU55_9STRE|nr:amino acid ABC transporter substrate-binding protein [Streptococcus loxodontisalivarius]MBM7643574.1 polar amino acid transport system substrate-binding protein [Streptococcus loxodontisalivarius]
MKKFLLGLVLLSGLLVTNTVSAADKEVVLATAGDIKPFSYENKKGKLTGYDIEVVKAASKYMDGYKISYKRTAWESIFVGMDSGHYQIAANNLSYTDERAQKYLYSLPIAKNPLVLVVPESSKITSLDDIGGKTTQDDTGTSTAQLIEDWNKEHTSKPSTIDYSGEDVAKRLLDLSNGEFDYLVFDKISVETIIEQKGYDLKVIDLDTGNNPNNYIVFSKDSEDMQEQFNQALKTMYENGQLEKLSQKYLGGSYLPDKAELE